MSNKMQKIADSLESGVIPEELSSLRMLGKAIKDNPEKYRNLRSELQSASTDEERLALLDCFAISEDRLRTMNTGGIQPTVTITITITITVTTWPNTAH